MGCADVTAFNALRQRHRSGDLVAILGIGHLDVQFAPGSVSRPSPSPLPPTRGPWPSS